MMKGTAFPKNSYRKPPSVKTWSFSETTTSWSISIWWIFVTKEWTEGWRDETAKRDESKRNSQRLGPLLLLRVSEGNHCTSQPMLARLSLWGTTILNLRAASIFSPVGDHGESTSVSKSRPNPLHNAHGNYSFIIHFRDLLNFHILLTFPFHNEIKSCL